MFKELLNSEQAIGYVGILAVVILFVSFLYLLFVVFRLSKKYVDKMGSLPLEENNIKN